MAEGAGSWGRQPQGSKTRALTMPDALLYGEDSVRTKATAWSLSTALQCAADRAPAPARERDLPCPPVAVEMLRLIWAKAKRLWTSELRAEDVCS